MVEVLAEVAGFVVADAAEEVGHFGAVDWLVGAENRVWNKVVGGEGFDEVFVPRFAAGEGDLLGGGGEAHRFEVGDVGGWAKGAVGIAGDPALAFGVANWLSVPLVFWNIFEAVAIVGAKVAGFESEDDNFGHFGAVDFAVWPVICGSGVTDDDSGGL